MNIVDVTSQGVEPPLWTGSLVAFASSVLDALHIANWEVSLLLCSDDVIRELNRTYRGRDEATDVLSFSQDIQPGAAADTIPAGDIVVSLDTLRRHAIEFDVPEEEELKRLVIHGLLHLSGLDHETNEPGEEMLAAQERLLEHLSEVRIF